MHSSLYLDFHHTFVLLRTFSNTNGPYFMLGEDSNKIGLPLSTGAHHKPIILSTDVNFLGSGGRWAFASVVRTEHARIA
ncbi:hypothetical protein Z517_12391 [Fonsecaea pedrosoi CBS 271.37]|uniref:Uncharacterized protein n=1 Tax=Fonsecaea pedrosoi CBS 271.37 TaxID=1442368 RepID=A0A0D2DA33_9EURO|nr:uncharacterized protein Z517_12391 [Fonsecaea pedrosoi CBS 271.37]KIW74451.1 hypothetical protein Z517_12391 [Fonsecaea pedrosoi CBS 271.37]